MKKIPFKLIYLSVLLILGGCSSNNEYVSAATLTDHLIGFLIGFFHGVIAPISLAASLFIPELGFYEVHNTGISYDFGFLLGILLWGSSGTQIIYKYRYTTDPNIAGLETKRKD